MPAPIPSLKEAVDRAVTFTRKYPVITVRLYECRKVGTPFVLAYEPFIVGEPDQGRKGLLYSRLGEFKGGELVSY